MMNYRLPRPELNVETWVYMTFGGQIRKLFWYKIGDDGSIYIGLAEQPKYVVHGTTQSEAFLSGAPIIGKYLRSERPMNIGKVSFHPSGKIHQDFDKRIINENFWDVKDRRLLLAIVLRDTRMLALATRKKDFTRPSIQFDANEFGFREDHSLQCAVMLRPVLDRELEPIDEPPYVQWASVYRDFTDERKKPMIVHFLLLGKGADKEPNKHSFFIYPHTAIS
jgi:hypothetical protein